MIESTLVLEMCKIIEIENFGNFDVEKSPKMTRNYNILISIDE